MNRLVFASLVFASACAADEPDGIYQDTPPGPSLDDKADSAALPPYLQYHHGHVMGGVPTVYFIWYGTWSYWGPSDTTTILHDFARDVGGSAWFDITTGYWDNFGDRVSGQLAVGAMATDPYDHGTYLDSLATMLGVVQASIDNHVLPLDPNGIYVIAASADVADPWVCQRACAWHNHGKVHGVDLKVVFLNDTHRCPSVCTVFSGSPNGNGVADMMANYLGHELAETVTDPLLTGWYIGNHDEIGDRCYQSYSDQYRSPNGGTANLHLRDRDYFVQDLWVNANPGYCAHH